MSKNIGYIGGGILLLASLCMLFFGVLYFFASFDPMRGQANWAVVGLGLGGVGLLLMAGAIALIIANYRKQKSETVQNVILQVDLPADVNVEKMKCQSCGGALSSKNIDMVAGAPMVTCPYCGTIYQLSEEPKW